MLDGVNLVDLLLGIGAFRLGEGVLFSSHCIDSSQLFLSACLEGQLELGSNHAAQLFICLQYFSRVSSSPDRNPGPDAVTEPP